MFQHYKTKFFRQKKRRNFLEFTQMFEVIAKISIKTLIVLVLDRSTEGKTSMLDVTNALCLPVLNVKISRFISKVSLKHFEEAATVLYNNPFSWCFWLNPIHIDIDLSEYMVCPFRTNTFKTLMKQKFIIVSIMITRYY